MPLTWIDSGDKAVNKTWKIHVSVEFIDTKDLEAGKNEFEDSK